MDRATIRRLAVRLNGGAVRGSSKALAEAMGVPVKTARAWLLDPKQDNHRVMSKTAKRLFALLVLLESTGKLDDLIQAARAMEKLIDSPGIDLQEKP
jgi:hypothetical protein